MPLQQPAGLACGPDGDLCASGEGTDQVLRYDGAAGDFMGVFASGGGLDRPGGVTCGPDNNLYGSRGLAHQVLRFNAEHFAWGISPGRSAGSNLSGCLWKPMLKIYNCEEIAAFRGEPWKDSIKKAAKARSEVATKRRRGG